jgi:hypothetical protein
MTSIVQGTSTGYVEGGKSCAICYACKILATTTFRYRDIPFSDGRGMAPGMLAAVCDTCDSVVAIPAQSTSTTRRESGSESGCGQS